MTHPSFGPNNPVGPGQYPPQSGQYPTPGPYPPGPAQRGGPPAGANMPAGPPVQVTPRKSRKGLWFVLVPLLCLLPVLCCGGAFGYFGWLQPKQERDHHTRIFESLGVPEGFTVTEPRFADGLETLEVTYYLLCEKKACPVNPAEKIHKWLTENKMTNMTLQDVQKCLNNAADDRKAELCVFEWKVDGKVVSAHAMWAPADRAEDRRWILDTEIRTPAD